LVRSLSASGDDAGAVAAFEEMVAIDAQGAGELVPEYARAMASRGKSLELDDFLTAYLRTYRVAPALRERIEKDLEWVRERNRFRPIWTLEQAEQTTFACSNPLLVHWDAKTRRFDTWRAAGAIREHGFIIPYDGRSFRLRARAIVHRLDWATLIMVGMMPWGEGSLPSVNCNVHRGGASDMPAARMGLWTGNNEPFRDIQLPPGREVQFDLEWFHGPKRATTRISVDPGGASWDLSLTTEHTILPGTCLIGEARDYHASGIQQYWAHYELTDLTMESAGAPMGLSAPELKDARDHFIVANGDFALGRVERAREGYARTLKEVALRIELDARSEELRVIEVGAYLFRSFLNRSAPDFERALDLDRAWVIRTLAESAPALTPEHRAWVRECVGRVAESPEDIRVVYGPAMAELLFDGMLPRLWRILDDADKLGAQGGFPEAEKLLLEALEISGNDSDVESILWLLRAEWRLDEKKYGESMNAVRKADGAAVSDEMRTRVERMRLRLAPFAEDF
jgi:tetratricopeptide (TPR) repeat protein